jgi:formate hydrogenlyase subunit 6/NADH:ubiquinone oxidoreductase subunit I
MIRPGKMVKQVLQSLLRKAATVQYPFVPIHMPAKFRGKLKFYPERCIGCKICMRDCPAKAIEIVKVADKQFDCVVDCSKCIYCAQCVDSCPKKALEATNEFELASLTRKPLQVTFKSSPKPAAPAEPASDVKPESKPAGDAEKKA